MKEQEQASSQVFQTIPTRVRTSDRKASKETTAGPVGMVTGRCEETFSDRSRLAGFGGMRDCLGTTLGLPSYQGVLRVLFVLLFHG